MLSLTRAIWLPDAVSDTDAKAYYEQRKDNYGKPEKRELRQMVFLNEEDALLPHAIVSARVRLSTTLPKIAA